MRNKDRQKMHISQQGIHEHIDGSLNEHRKSTREYKTSIVMTQGPDARDKQKSTLYKSN